MVKKYQDINKHMTVQFPEHVKYNWSKQLKVVSTAKMILVWEILKLNHTYRVSKKLKKINTFF